jgi:hypothetical protein
MDGQVHLAGRWRAGAASLGQERNNGAALCSAQHMFDEMSKRK